MKKRLRKKKRIGEFQELGFHIGYRLSEQLDEGSVDEFFDRFLEQAIEGSGLLCGGGGQFFEFSWFVMNEKSRKSVSGQQRATVKEWVLTQPEVVEYNISPLKDAWHGDFDEEFEWVKK